MPARVQRGSQAELMHCGLVLHRAMWQLPGLLLQHFPRATLGHARIERELMAWHRTSFAAVVQLSEGMFFLTSKYFLYRRPRPTSAANVSAVAEPPSMEIA